MVPSYYIYNNNNTMFPLKCLKCPSIIVIDPGHFPRKTFLIDVFFNMFPMLLLFSLSYLIVRINKFLYKET